VTRVYWDSMLFIYMLEANPGFAPKVRRILNQIADKEYTLSTSVFSIGEILTGPRRRGSISGADAVKKYFSSGAVEILPFNEAAADRYGTIRGTTRVSQADAIQLASAAEAGVDVFFTNDIDLLRLRIPGIKLFADLDGRII
jgi:uncharacterized protein